MQRRSGLVTLLTDFGLRDPFVGILHGVIASRGPGLRVIDLTHQVPPQAIGCGAFYLRHAFSWFPQGTVHVAVVDPGVGSQRHAVVVQALGHLFVAPDNGLLGDVLKLAADQGARVASYRVDTADPALNLTLSSATFHGRDVFAPVGAALALGLRASQVGPELASPLPSPNSTEKRVQGGFEAQVVVVDHFGNCITNLYVQELCPEALQRPEGYVARVEQLCLPLVRTYSDVADGQLCALVNSFGALEIAARNGNAVRQLNESMRARRELTRDIEPPLPSPQGVEGALGFALGSRVQLLKRG